MGAAHLPQKNPKPLPLAGETAPAVAVVPLYRKTQNKKGADKKVGTFYFFEKLRLSAG